jgi:hypothetical protein
VSPVEAPSSIRQHEFSELAHFRAAHGLVLSLFFGFDPAVTSTCDEVATRLASLLEQAKRVAAPARERLGHAARLAFDDDLERTRNEVLRRLGPASVACFADSADGLWHVFEVPGPLPDRARVQLTPYLLPLAAAPAEERALVAAVGRERGSIFQLRSGQLEQLVDVSEDQPRRHGEGQAWQQPSIERHVDELARVHLGRVAGSLDSLARAQPGARLVLAGEQKQLVAFRSLLAPDVRSAVAGVVHAEAHAGATELLPLVLSVLARCRQDDEAALLDRWEAAIGRAEGAVQGLADTLAAASNGRIEVLLFHDGNPQPVCVCPSCGRASATAGVCPLDGQPLEEEADGLDVAIRLTLAHGGRAQAVRDHTDLDRSGGIGALLRFAEAPHAATAGAHGSAGG